MVEDVSDAGANADPYAMETPFDCFKRPDVLDTLRKHPSTQKHMLDTGFLERLEQLRTVDPKDQQKQANLTMNDPRIMQAMGVLQDWGLSFTEKELKHAESVGDIKKRDAVQVPDLQHAYQYATPSEAKDEGNRCFKEGHYTKALACYHRVRHLYSQMAEQGPDATEKVSFPPPDPALASTLASNAAAALLKLDRPAEALKEVDEAVRTAAPGQDLSKAHYRAAQAHEALAKKTVSEEKASPMWTAAVDAARAALTAAKAAQAQASEREGTASTAALGAVTHLQRELRRYKEAEKAAKAKAEAEVAQRARDSQASEKRGLGMQQKPAEKKSQSALISQPTIGYVRDIDLSTFATGWLSREVALVVHKWADGSIRVDSLVDQQSDIHASIKEKRGKRSLFFDLTLVLKWEGRSRLGRSKDSYGEMSGIIKMYNIGQDTKFELGGDKETSYMYELGLAPQYHSATEPWVAQVKSEAAEVFEVVSNLILDKFVPALEAKGALVK